MAEKSWLPFFHKWSPPFGNIMGKGTVKSTIGTVFKATKKCIMVQIHCSRQGQGGQNKCKGHGVPKCKEKYLSRALWQSIQVRAWSPFQTAGHHFLILTGLVCLIFLPLQGFNQQRAMAALAINWLQQGAAKWQKYPWYAILLRQCKGLSASSSEPERPHQVVGKALQQ